MRRIWVVARQALAEAIRMKVALAFLFLLGVMFIMLPLAEGDGTLTGRVQAFLSYSVASTFVLTAVLTIFLGCATIANEIRDRQIHTIACKPIPRWQYFAGKWLGVVLFDFLLLVLSGTAIYVSVHLIKTGSRYDDEARAELANQVLTARFGARPTPPDFSQAIEERYQRLREQGPLPEFVTDPHDNYQVPGTEENIKKNLRHEIEREWTYVPSGASRTFVFEKMFIEPVPDKKIYVRFKMEAEHLPPDMLLSAGWSIGDRSKGAASFIFPRRDVVSRFHEIEVPATAVASDQTVMVTFHNFNMPGSPPGYGTGVHLGGAGHVEVLFPLGTFGGNLFRAMCILFCCTIFLAALGVFTSTWLSFPVACLVSMFVWVASLSLGFVGESIAAPISTNTGEETTRFVLTLLKPAAWLVTVVMPDLSFYNPAGKLADGRLVTLPWVLHAIGNLVLFKSLLVGILGAVIFQNRELAKVTA